ncbi:putative FAD-binding dehydrogenase [Devosia equisanguinis]|uniref:Putative FAD-binding dehydrogenase n=1 Tax=Devosia equisanguinis TaxID=2490941 RepID=A0A3S4D5Y9_9HYPH|nr:FAD-dependent oxidoreductase [Devosia equisanguinis]VDS05248.1 putative FAD-binding dehydrogenase [Devosia equisanguinis]
MRHQSARLSPDSAKLLAGRAIDRSRPLTFQLDGRQISGFVGDTVLSAVLAAGIDTLGSHHEQLLGLGPHCHPPIAYAALARDGQRALPMDRTPALTGADLVTVGGARRAGLLARLFQPGRTLGLGLEDPHALDQPWRDVSGVPAAATDLLVIGGGVAGMAAALAGARAGLSVTLVEASPVLGGHSGIFGTQEGEDSPDASMSRLAADIAAQPAISVLTCSQVFALRPGKARLHQVVVDGGTAQGRVTDIDTRHIIVATGSLERLPIFAGNRLPGVIGALDAYELAARYGVWPGGSAIIATAGNAAYWLAKLASDAGISVDRIFDSRSQPNSRFIAFTKAYGIRQFPGTRPQQVVVSGDGGAVDVRFGVEPEQTAITERLIVNGGWQPDLTLWHVAGGTSQWNGAHHRLEPVGPLDGIALAGSAAGFLTRRGCIQSGADAVDLLLGRKRQVIDDPVIDALHETPDDDLPFALPTETEQIAYLDHTGLLQRPGVEPKAWWHLFRRAKTPSLPALSEASQPLTIAEVSAGVSLGLVPPASAGIVAQERVALVPLTSAAANEDMDSAAPVQAMGVPDYLVGRFGGDGIVVRLALEESRAVAIGALLYRSSDAKSPLEAIGTVLRTGPGGPLALVSAAASQSGGLLTLRDQGRAVTARVVPLTETLPA